MKVIDIPKTIESKDLELTVCKIFNIIGFGIGEVRIEVCHRLVKLERAIALSLSFLEGKIVTICCVLKIN